MHVWRICAAKYQDSAFSGIGGLYVPGRWHTQGHKIVYTAESLALASLEIFVHLESDRVPLVAIKANIPDGLEMEEIKIENMPKNWQDPDSYSKLQKIGQSWLISRRTPILKVPSAIVPVESNFLFNPEHPQFKIDLKPPIRFCFDRRMWKSS
ncbi:MAG: RES family NAD+ phosphorylase [Hydrococcus sp. SU_1_0]|nr:RES family NAD+ phosphorylase [Hydrococcus sp. SU_1_0]NJO96200.1 RES family NAD+ phosphorylase [Pleurocapsa sp. CRU_1_2]